MTHKVNAAGDSIEWCWDSRWGRSIFSEGNAAVVLGGEGEEAREGGYDLAREGAGEGKGERASKVSSLFARSNTAKTKKKRGDSRCNTLERTVTHCKTLQHAAIYSNTFTYMHVQTLPKFQGVPGEQLREGGRKRERKKETGAKDAEVDRKGNYGANDSQAHQTLTH